MHGRATLAPGFLNNSGLSRRLDLMPGNPPGYSTSYAERERLHLRQETYFGRRTSQSNSVPAILEPVKRLVSKARLKWDTAYYQRQLGRLPVAKPWQWEQAKSQTGYDAQEPLTVPAHAWECWARGSGSRCFADPATVIIDT